MILYHGSHLAIEKPDLSFSRERTDFGRGFYLTPIKEQAHNWAKRFVKEGNQGVVSAYTFLHRPAAESLPEYIKVLEFETHSIEWLHYIMNCRLGKNTDRWDLVIGGVANDKVFDTLQLYFDGVVDAATAIGRLRYNKPNFQYCFKNQELMDAFLCFQSAEEIVL
jgi:hypothetical protein